jgi:hypothetical protein
MYLAFLLIVSLVALVWTTVSVRSDRTQSPPPRSHRQDPAFLPPAHPDTSADGRRDAA